MKPFKIILIIILISLTVFVFYQVGKKYFSPVVTKSKETELICPYKMEAGIFKEFVRSADEVEIIGVPEFIENPEVIKIKKPFNKKEFETDLDKKLGPSGLVYKEFDVDEDGKSETIVSYNLTMNHTPNVALIVKNGNIIFEAEGGST